MRPNRRQEQNSAIKRELIAAAVVIVAVIGVGFLLAFMTGDAKRLFDGFRFALIDDTPSIPTASDKPIARPIAKGCKYCATVRELQQSFAIKAQSALDQRNAAARAVRGESSSDKGVLAARKQDLLEAESLLERTSTAASVLKEFSAACEQEEFCRPNFLTKAAATCPETPDDAAMRGPALGMAAAARDTAIACIAAQCPSIDCGKAAVLRHDLINAASALSKLGRPIQATKGAPTLSNLPVGPATLATELTRTVKEVEYLAKLFPSMLEGNPKQKPGAMAQPPGQQLTAMISSMVAKRADDIRNAADVMTQASVFTPFPNDARREAAWRMKSLSLSVTEAGILSDPATLQGPQGQAQRRALTQSWGAALVDLAAVAAMLDRMKAENPVGAGCSGATAAAAQAARDAAALMDICRARAACPVSTGIVEAARQPTLDPMSQAREMLKVIIPRAQSDASVIGMSVGPAPTVTQQPAELGQSALVLAAGGACRVDTTPSP